jgi:hypothetical protein
LIAGAVLLQAAALSHMIGDDRVALCQKRSFLNQSSSGSLVGVCDLQR